MPEIRDTLMRLIGSKRWARLLEDPRMRDAVVRGLRLRARLGTAVDDRIEALASTLNLATQREIRELKRTLRRLERELESSRGRGTGRVEDLES